jgi:poly(3-hydroxybutyrate) depolymerase
MLSSDKVGAADGVVDVDEEADVAEAYRAVEGINSSQVVRWAEQFRLRWTSCVMRGEALIYGMISHGMTDDSMG